MRRPTNNLAIECLHRVNGETVFLNAQSVEPVMSEKVA